MHWPREQVPKTTQRRTESAVVVVTSNGDAGATHTHYIEPLRECESIDLSRPALRCLLVKASISSPQASVPSNTVSGGVARPWEGCRCRPTAANTHGWRTGEPSRRRSSPWKIPLAPWLLRYSVPRNHGASIDGTPYPPLLPCGQQVDDRFVKQVDMDPPSE